MIAISPRQLEVFSIIAAAGSVRAAADQLGLTQPAASMALGELERLLGEPLFDRQQRRLKLNEHGRALLPRAREIVERLRELGSTAEPGGALAVGASNTILRTVGSSGAIDATCAPPREKPSRSTVLAFWPFSHSSHSPTSRGEARSMTRSTSIASSSAVW